MSWKNTIIDTDVKPSLDSAFANLITQIKRETKVDKIGIAKEIRDQLAVELAPSWKASIKDDVVHGKDGRDGKDGKSIVGPKGDRGEKGEPGKSIKGEKGDPGISGKDGATWHLVSSKPENDFGGDKDFCFNKSNFEIYHKENGEWENLGTIKGKNGSGIGGAYGQAEILFKDDGSALGSTGSVNEINFTGSGVTATRTGNTLNVAVSSGGGGGGGGNTRVVDTVAVNTSAGSDAATDYFYIVTNGSTITLPTAVGNENLYNIKRTGSSAVTVATTGAETIDGSATISLNLTNECRQIISDGTNWVVI